MMTGLDRTIRQLERTLDATGDVAGWEVFIVQGGIARNVDEPTAMLTTWGLTNRPRPADVGRIVIYAEGGANHRVGRRRT